MLIRLILISFPSKNFLAFYAKSAVECTRLVAESFSDVVPSVCTRYEQGQTVPSNSHAPEQTLY